MDECLQQPSGELCGQVGPSTAAAAAVCVAAAGSDQCLQCAGQQSQLLDLSWQTEIRQGRVGQHVSVAVAAASQDSDSSALSCGSGVGLGHDLWARAVGSHGPTCGCRRQHMHAV